MKSAAAICCCLVFFVRVLSAQVMITGKVSDAKALHPLYPATVLDQTAGGAVYTDTAGNYRILVNLGDTLRYSYLGYHPRQYVVPLKLASHIMDIPLVPQRQNLREVEVQGSSLFLPDSLWKIYTSQPPETPRERLLDHQIAGGLGGFGLTFHPFTYFSKAEHLKRRLHKLRKAQEKERFSDARYAPELVHQITGLTGDSLQLFLQRYRPTFEFSRTASQPEFWSWIRLQYLSWVTLGKKNSKNGGGNETRSEDQ